MLDTMYRTRHRLIAVQVGILKRLIVIDISKDEEKNPLFLINPEIISKSDKTSTCEEGCSSLPGHFAEVERPAECQIKFVDYDGKERTKGKRSLGNLHTTEVDHLNGVLFIDYLSKLKKDMIIKIIKHKKELNKVIL